MKKISKPLLHVIRPSTKIIEFHHVKFSECASYEDGV